MDVNVGGVQCLQAVAWSVVRWCLSSFPSASRQASPGTLASAGEPCWESANSGGLICLRREGRLAGETIGRQSNNNVSHDAVRHAFLLCAVFGGHATTEIRSRRITASACRPTIDLAALEHGGRARQPHQCDAGDYVMRT